MDDLINRQDAIEKFEPWLRVDGYSEGELNMLKAVLYELRFLPSAHPEIIRCKDCKYKNVYRFPPKYGERDYCVKHEKTVDVADFCSWAERRAE